MPRERKYSMMPPATKVLPRPVPSGIHTPSCLASYAAIVSSMALRCCGRNVTPSTLTSRRLTSTVCADCSASAAVIRSYAELTYHVRKSASAFNVNNSSRNAAGILSLINFCRSSQDLRRPMIWAAETGASSVCAAAVADWRTLLFCCVASFGAPPPIGIAVAAAPPSLNVAILDLVVELN